MFTAWHEGWTWLVKYEGQFLSQASSDTVEFGFEISLDLLVILSGNHPD